MIFIKSVRFCIVVCAFHIYAARIRPWSCLFELAIPKMLALVRHMGGSQQKTNCTNSRLMKRSAERRTT